MHPAKKTTTREPDRKRVDGGADVIELRPAARQAAIENVARVLLGQGGYDKEGSEQARLRLALRKLLSLLEQKTIKAELGVYARGLAASGGAQDVDAALLIQCAIAIDSVPKKLRNELRNKASIAHLATRTRTESDGKRYVKLDATSPLPLKLRWLLDVARTYDTKMAGASYGWRSVQLAGLIQDLFPKLVRFSVESGDYFPLALGIAITDATEKRLPLLRGTLGKESDRREVVRIALATSGALTPEIDGLFAHLRKSDSRKRLRAKPGPK